MSHLVIVESPSKAKTIHKYLGRDYAVMASFGHVRDLAAKDGSVDPAADFAMQWEVDGKAAKRLSDIAAAAKNADKVILATDPDREGEAISWHILEVLKGKRVLKDKTVERVTFNAITKDAVEAALRQPRPIDQALVDAYRARRALDYLVGFNLSPVLWRKLPGARSAGRVQSVALRLVCEREMEIERFVPREYWSLVATLRAPNGDSFEARLVGVDGRKIGRLDVGNEAEARDFEAALKVATFAVRTVEAKPARRHPPPPFTTSTLQQEASRKLGIAPAITMRIAQKLYEGVAIGGETVGLITYMRTDGVQMAGEAIAQTRRLIARDFGDAYLPGVPRAYSTKAKNAQEAHEAIRPTDLFRTPGAVRAHLSGDDLQLYELIWNRTVASQMESAVFERTTVDLRGVAGGRVLDLRATGQVVTFPGFLAVYEEGRDEVDSDEQRRLPPLREGDATPTERIAATQHFTEPPPRYSEASLVKRLEELGIGRPSTYASILQVLKDREYVRLDKKRLHPEDKGRLVTAFLESFFRDWVEYDFTAALENDLDRISNNEIDWKAVMRAFWERFSAAVGSTTDLRTGTVIDALDAALGPHLFPAGPDGRDTRACPRCGSGRLGLKLSRTGPFIGCSNYPACRYTRPFGVAGETSETPGALTSDGARLLGTDPATGLEVTARNGRYGPFVQLGEGEKPKRASLPKGTTLATITLSEALRVLALPREVGRHPDGEPILANVGRFGPYVQHGKTFANLGKDEDVYTIGINRAVDLIEQKKLRGSTRTGRGAAAGRVVGEHPEGGEVRVSDGRYGPYASWNGINATLPKDLDKETVTLDALLPLLAARAKAAPAKTRKRASQTTAKAAGKTGAPRGKAKPATDAKAPAGGAASTSSTRGRAKAAGTRARGDAA